MKNHNEIILACASGQLGGTELRIIEEASALRELGYQATVAVSPFDRMEKYKALLAARDIPFFDFNPPRVLNDWRLRHLNHLRSLFYPRARLQGARLMHIAFPWTNLGLDHLWMAGLAGVPVVISAHNAFPYTPFTPWHQRHLRTAFRRFRGVYGVSRSAQQHFEEIFGTFMPSGSQSELIYNFADTTRFQPSETHRQTVRQALGIGPDTKLIGSVGRLDIQKRPLSLISVFNRLRKRLSDSHLLLIGEGSLEDEVHEAIAHYKLQDQVTILGFQRDIERYFPAMDLHLLLSGNEGFGLVTAEAMACGVPAVGSRVPGTSEVIGNSKAGRLADLDDEEATVEAICELLDLQDQNRSVMIQCARSHVIDHFSREIWLRHIEQFYAKALGTATPESS